MPTTEKDLVERLRKIGYGERYTQAIVREVGEKGVDFLIKHEIVPNPKYKVSLILKTIREGQEADLGLNWLDYNYSGSLKSNEENRVSSSIKTLERDLGAEEVITLLDEVRFRKHALEDLEKRLIKLGKNYTTLEKERLMAEDVKVEWEKTFGQIYLKSGFIDENGLQSILKSENFGETTSKVLKMYNFSMHYFRLRLKLRKDVGLERIDNSPNLLTVNLIKYFNNLIRDEMKDFGISWDFVHQDKVVYYGLDEKQKVITKTIEGVEETVLYENIILNSGIANHLKVYDKYLPQED